MLVQALAEYADNYLSEDLEDEAWEDKPVPYLIEFSEDGAFLGVVSRLRSEVRGKKTIALSETLRVPKSPVKRNSGLHPLLAADNVKYVLGVGPWTGAGDDQQLNAAERHEAFVKLIGFAAESTRDPALRSAAVFYSRRDQVDLARAALSTVKADTFVALSAGGPIMHRPDVRKFWTSHFKTAFGTRLESGGIGECIITGKIGPIAPTHDPIKGMASLGGQSSGVALMSFDKRAFRSYGWEQNANSPISPDRATAYVLALNDLLRTDKGKRKDIAGIAFTFWTRKPSAFDPYKVFDADTEQVRSLLAFDPKADPEPNQFYMAGLSANGARLLVRYWVADSLTRVKVNLKSWFEGLQVVGLNGEPAHPPKLWHLQYALDREGEPQSRRVVALVRRGLEGSAQPLGYDMLSAVVSRLRHPAENKAGANKDQETRFTPSRLGLVRLCLNDLLRNGEKTMTASLDSEQTHPAYLCGRLLAEYEDLQNATYWYAKEAQVNQTVADRYFTLASVSPMAAFPRINSLGKAHFKKLAKYSPAAQRAIEQRLAELQDAIGTAYPRNLGLDGQGRFALGYYHQKAENQRARHKNSNKQQETDINEETPTE